MSGEASEVLALPAFGVGRWEGELVAGWFAGLGPDDLAVDDAADGAGGVDVVVVSVAEQGAVSRTSLV